MATKRKRIIYATKERKERVNEQNKSVYEKYLKRRISRNKDVKDTTYRQYTSAFYIWLCFLLEEYDNPYILDEEFIEDQFLEMIDDYVYFLQDTLGNHKKKINFNLSAISSFYIYAVESRLVKYNPMSNVRRMERANDEHIIDADFLTQQQVDKIYDELKKALDPEYKGQYDLVDLVLWSTMFISTSRIGAIHQLTMDKLVLDEARNIAYFDNIREKRGKITKVVIDLDTYGYIQELIGRRREDNNSEFLFTTFHDGQWKQTSKHTLYDRIKRIGYIVGLDGFRPHSVRKTRANLLYKEYGIEATQQILLHESSDTTMKHYIEKTGVDDVFAKIMNGDN